MAAKNGSAAALIRLLKQELLRYKIAQMLLYCAAAFHAQCERISESAKKTPPQALHARREQRTGSAVRGPIPSAAVTRPGLKLMGPISQYHR